MEESMRNRLEAVKKRFANIEIELADPALNNDIPKLTALSKERASLEDENSQYIRYQKLESDLKDAMEIINGSDAEMAEMMKEERKSIEAEMTSLEATLKEELIPVDPNDKKNIIVEIRGAVGGDEANIFAGDLLRMYTKYAESRAGAFNTSMAKKGGGWRLFLRFLHGQRRERLFETEIRKRCPPGSAGSEDRGRGPDPHVDRDGPCDARSRRNRCENQPRRSQDRYLSFPRRRRPERQQDRIGGSRHPHSDGNRGLVPNREGPASE
jgi:hypothetical protein